MSEPQISPAKEILRKYLSVFREAWNSRHSEKNRLRYRVTEADFLPAALAVSERPTPVAPRLALWGLIALVIAGVAWSIIGKLDVVVVASGKTIASGRTHPVQSLETQIVRRVLVSEGQNVEEGDVLIEADRTSAEADRNCYKSEILQFERTISAYQALLQALEGQKIDIEEAKEPFVDVDDPAIHSIVVVRWGDFSKRFGRAKQEFKRRKAEEAVSRTMLANAEARLELRNKIATDYRAMMKAGVAAQHAWIERQIVLDDLHRDMAQISAQIKLAVEASAVAMIDVQAVHAETRALWYDRLADARREREAARAEHERAETRIRNAIIRASTAGKIQQLGALAPGHVVTSGQAVAAIVPNMPVEEVEVQIENRDIGFISIGQEAAVKISAYDYTRYGTIKARVVYISTDAIADDKGILRFVARLSLESNAFLTDGVRLVITPGMEVLADVKVGRRTIINYFLSPILKTLSEAVRER